MSGHQTATIEDTVYFWFAANDTSGSGGDGATPLFDVREAGAADDAIPLLSGTPTLLTHANFPAGCHEIAVAATAGNGFAADDTFAVFCTIAVDSQNPSGFVGSCTLTPLAKAAALATAQADLDIITGAAGALLDSTATSAQLVDDVWDEALSGHLTTGTAGQFLTFAGAVLVDTTATGVPTATEIQLTAGSAVNDFYNDQMLRVISGTGAGQARPILSYAGATKTVTIDEPFATTPASGDGIIIISDHVHPTTQIAAGVWSLDATGQQTQGTFGQAVGDPGATAKSLWQAVVSDASGVSVAADVIAVDTAVAALVDYDPTAQISESYAANGVAPTRDEAMMAIHQMLMDFSIAGTALTVEQLGGTTAFTVTLDDATNPTSANRA